MNTLTIVALVQTTPMIVYRILSVCRRYRAQVESVTVARMERRDVSQMTLVLHGAPADPLLAQLRKLIDVLEIHMVEAPESLSGRQPSSPSPNARQDSRASSFPSHSAQADGAF